MTPIKYIKKRLAHSGAKTYNWQQYALNIMNEEIHTNLNIEDIYIEEDRQKIYNYSKKNPQIINNSNSSNIVSVNTKICKKCNKTKNTNQFFKSKKAEYGYGYWCKECLSNKHK